MMQLLAWALLHSTQGAQQLLAANAACLVGSGATQLHAPPPRQPPAGQEHQLRSRSTQQQAQPGLPCGSKRWHGRWTACWRLEETITNQGQQVGWVSVRVVGSTCKCLGWHARLVSSTAVDHLQPGVGWICATPQTLCSPHVMPCELGPHASAAFTRPRPRTCGRANIQQASCWRQAKT